MCYVQYIYFLFKKLFKKVYLLWIYPAFFRQKYNKIGFAGRFTFSSGMPITCFLKLVIFITSYKKMPFLIKLGLKFVFLHICLSDNLSYGVSLSSQIYKINLKMCQKCQYWTPIYILQYISPKCRGIYSPQFPPLEGGGIFTIIMNREEN